MDSKIIILAGGPTGLLPDLASLDAEDITWVGVDRGVHTLLKNNIAPDQAFGDFDSVSLKEREWMNRHPVNFSVFPQEKDKTDLELAIEWALEKQCSSVIILGATGGRLDHELINVQLLLKGIGSKTEIEIRDRQNRIQLRAAGSYEIKYIPEYPYLSFVPVTPKVEGLTLTGVKYPLQETEINWGSTLSISNELVNKKGSYSFRDGILLVIRSKDEDEKAFLNKGY
ncbi:thiamine diphosphokinase [Pseudalkalibacillus caeni]|uniref:Thiamine diphosphokinase n=1 Tax=Exobacillus caeni TaxID=2574798 RepID=A0A5R9F905_9BACL|nr:thiamine diphosphokinase [Pseudalkalibacillus caeni]TLS37323.1 thiamine diphosphokinase [Pseudalkalibacillus caeni]